MNDDEIYDVVVETLTEIAPEVEETGLAPEQPLRSQVDLDSMDWLNFLIGLRKALDVEIPEQDYSRLVTPDDLVRYLHDRVADRSDD